MSGGIGRPELPQAIAAVIDRRLESVHTAYPGQVTRVYEGGVRVDVAHCVRWRYTDELGKEVVEALPIVQNTPVVWPGGAYDFTSELSVGDTGLVIVSEASIDEWLALGGIVETTDYRRHYFGTGAVFLPGLRDHGNGKRADVIAGASFGANGGLRAQVTATEIKLGASAATQAAVNGNAYRTAEDVFLAAIVTALVALGRTEMTGVKAAFDAAAATYLSTTVKIKP